MRRKEYILSFRPTSKNKLYLSELGYLDARTGMKNKNCKHEMSDLINRCVTIVLENKKGIMGDHATGPELLEAWLAFEKIEAVKELQRAQDRVNEINDEREQLRVVLEVRT